MRYLTILAVFVMLGCGDSGVSPPRADEPLATADLTVVSGAAQTDTIEAELGPLIVELTAGAEAAPLPGILVNFSLPDFECGSLSAGSALTDASGRAATVWTLGRVARGCGLDVRAMDANGTPQLFASAAASLGGLVADAVAGSYSRFDGSATSEPYHTAETHVRLGG